MPSSPLTSEQRQQLRRDCTLIVPDFAALTPAEEFARMAAWCEAHGVEHDHYGNGALAADLERKIAALLGKPAAVFMPSGVMPQLAARRIHTQAARPPRFALHRPSPPALSEEEAFRSLPECHRVPVGHRLSPMGASAPNAMYPPRASAMGALRI